MNSDSGSTGCRTRAARWVAYVLAGAIAVSLPITLAARATSRVLFDAQSVSRILSFNLIDSGLLRQVVVKGLLTVDTEGQVTASDLGRMMTYADEQQRQAAADIVVPAGWAQDQLDALTLAFYDWLDSDATAPDLTIQLAPIRENLLDGGIGDLVDLIWSTWPDCTPEQLGQIQSSLLADQSPPLTACRPPQPVADSVRSIMIAGLADEVRTMPDSLPLADTTSPGSVASLQEAKSFLVSARLLSTWLWLAPASLLGLIVALVVRSWTGLFRWWGIPILAGALAGIALAAAGNTLGVRWLEGQLPAAVQQVPPVLQGVVTGMVSQMFQAIIRTLMRQSFLIAGAAGIVTLVGALAGRSAQAPETTGGEAPIEDASTMVSVDDDEDSPSGMFG